MSWIGKGPVRNNISLHRPHCNGRWERFHWCTCRRPYKIRRKRNTPHWNWMVAAYSPQDGLYRPILLCPSFTLALAVVDSLVAQDTRVARFYAWGGRLKERDSGYDYGLKEVRISVGRASSIADARRYLSEPGHSAAGG